MEIGEIEAYFDNKLSEILAELEEPMKKAMEDLFKSKKLNVTDYSEIFEDLADYFKELNISLNNYTDAVKDIDKEQNLEELELRRADTEEMLEGVSFIVDKILDYLKGVK